MAVRGGMDKPRAVPAATPGTSYLSIAGIRKSFGQVDILKSFDLDARPGEFVTLLGPSGCGKTTLLRLVAGLLTPDDGSIRIEGKDITKVPTHQRNVGMMFQSYALFPHMTVKQNVAFGLVVRKHPKSVTDRKVADALELVQMSHLAHQSVTNLSGGQQQRVSLARALVVEPALILFDEPFSALDKKLREAMQIELKSILRKSGSTAIFVTHDQEEALALSDRIVVMNAGRVEQAGTPYDVYSNPASEFVLDFMGQSNKIEAVVTATSDGACNVETAYGKLVTTSNHGLGERLVLAVRPEHVSFEQSKERINSIACRVSDLVFLGGRTLVVLQGEGVDRFLAEVKGRPSELEIGSASKIYWSPKTQALFSRETRRG